MRSFFFVMIGLLVSYGGVSQAGGIVDCARACASCPGSCECTPFSYRCGAAAVRFVVPAARGYSAACNEASDAACQGLSSGSACKSEGRSGTCEIPAATADLWGGCYCLGRSGT
jgi:hypothetical protein